MLQPRRGNSVRRRDRLELAPGQATTEKLPVQRGLRPPTAGATPLPLVCSTGARSPHCTGDSPAPPATPQGLNAKGTCGRAHAQMRSWSIPGSPEGTFDPAARLCTPGAAPHSREGTGGPTPSGRVPRPRGGSHAPGEGGGVPASSAAPCTSGCNPPPAHQAPSPAAFGARHPTGTAGS